MRFVIALVLAVLLALTQMKLWWGERSSVKYVQTMQKRLDEVQAGNALMHANNTQLKAQIRDLQEGTEILEEQARSELGMVKPNEVLIQLR